MNSKATTTSFQAGQRVRLTAPFTGRCMTYRGTSELVFGEPRKPPQSLPRGTVLTVFVNPTPTDKRLTNRCRAADPLAVLELVSNNEPQGKEPTGDAQGSRVG